MAAAAAGFFFELNSFNRDATIHGLAHVVDG